MKIRKIFGAVLACALMGALVLTGCGKKEEAFSDDYALSDVTLCGTDTNDASFMKGFSMMGTIGELASNPDVFSVAMCYSTAGLEEVQNFFRSEQFSDPDSFMAELDALDLDGKIRNLSGDKLSYFDGALDNPIRFYGDGVDLINGTSLLQNAGEYHFYLVTMGYDKALWVGEADRTFVMEQSAIDLAADFAAAFEAVMELEPLTGVDTEDQDAMTKAVLDTMTEKVDALDLGITVTVEYENDPDYPDDYLVTLAKDGAETHEYVPVYFGA